MKDDFNTLAITPINLREEQWKLEAACQGADTEAYFREVGEVQRDERRMVKRICASCPVRTECLEYAIKYNMQGWWGGLSQHDRVAIKSRRNKENKVA